MNLIELKGLPLLKKRTSHKKILLEALPAEAVNFIEKHADLDDTDNTAVLKTGVVENLENVRSSSNFLGSEVQAIINIKRVNESPQLNKLINGINSRLTYGGVFIGCAETIVNRKARILNKFIFPFNYIYYFFDVIFKRVFPKIWGLKWLYFFVTADRNRVLSEIEVYGRLTANGFSFVESKEVNNLLYFVFEKIEEPEYKGETSYGPLIKLSRIGKNGKVISVYKLRTMYAYSEYLQEMIYNQNSLADGGKFKNDPRISSYGKVFRKFWLDELPMAYNMLRGDMKIVGVRPLSKHYYGLYPESLQTLRIKTKPGLIPPFYADLPKTLEEIVASEERYLNAYLKNPVLTDLKYFSKAVYNILIKRARSK